MDSEFERTRGYQGFSLGTIGPTLVKSALNYGQFCIFSKAVVVQALTFTIKDVCHALSGVSRSRVHAWTRLPPFALMETSERSARRFDVTDMLTLAALQKLEDVYGIKSRHMDRFSEGIHRYLAQPRAIGTDELIFVSLNDGKVWNLDAASVSEPGWVLDIAEDRERINVFLGIAPPQRQLALVASMQG